MSRAMTTTLSTMALSALAALSLVACIGDADLADAPAGTATVAAAAADAANCQWLRSAEVLDGRLVLDYQGQSDTPQGGRLRMRHVADVRGELQLLQRDAKGAVWSGALRQGRLALNDSQLLPDRSGQLRLKGDGAPQAGPGLAGSVATVRVDFADCKLRYAARLALQVQASADGADALLPMREMGRLAVSGLVATGGPLLFGTQRLPAGADDGDGADADWPGDSPSGHYRPAGLADEPGAALQGPAGEALLRWSFRARA